VANATTFNNAFISKSANSTTTGVVTLDNGSSGATVSNLQQKVNDTAGDLVIAEGDIATLQSGLSSLTGVVNGHDAELGLLTDVVVDNTTTGADASLAAPAGGVVIVENAGLTGIGGIPAGFNGQQLTLINRTGDILEILHRYTTDQFIDTGAGASIEMLDNSAIQLRYDEAEEVWQVVGGSGSGGGGGFLTQYIYGNNVGVGGAASYDYEAGQKVWVLQPTQGEKIFSVIDVPLEYIAGNEINLYAKFRTAATADDVEINCVLTLIRTAVDDYNSTTNQVTSAVTPITMSAPSANKNLAFTYTVAAGEINSVAISPGDLILVELFEDGSTVSENIRVIDKMEVIFDEP
jgi:hypothetical protein